ncbi:MAG: glycosyltransferase family 39 protein [Flavobacteriales bacterium]|nr:glycosyltransferase family 39 protein [Flavobacteriales bacterium]
MKRWHADTLAIAALVALATMVRALFAGASDLANDEPFTLFQAHRDLSHLFAMLRTENNPPLYFLLIKLWLPIAGNDVALLRLPAVVASGLTVWPLYVIGRRLGGWPLAWTTALLFICSNYHQQLAHEVRAYSLFALLATAGMWQLVRHMHRSPSDGPPRYAWVWLALLNVAMSYTHFFGWLMIGVQSACVLTVPALRTARRSWALASGASILAYLPYGIIFLQRAGQSLTEGTWLERPRPEEVYNMIWRFSNAPVVAVVFLAVIALALLRRHGRDPCGVIGLWWGLAPVVGMFVASQWAPMFLDRYLVYAAPGFVLLVAHALLSLANDHRVALTLSAMGVVAMALTFAPDMAMERRPSVVVAVADAMTKHRAPVLIAPPWYALTFAWHTDPTLFDRPERLDSALSALSILPVHDPRTPLDTSEWRTIVLVDAGSTLSDPKGVLARRLEQFYPERDSVEADHAVWVTRFRR